MDIFNAVINSKISTEQILEWLSTDDLKSVPLLDIIQTNTTKAEFIIYFLDYIKTQCESFINVSPSTLIVNVKEKKNFNKFGHNSNKSSKVQHNGEEHPQQKDDCYSTPKHNSNSFEKNLADISISGQSIRGGLTSTPLKSNVTANIISPDIMSPPQTANLQCYAPCTPNGSVASNVENTPSKSSCYSLNQSWSANVSNTSYATKLNQSQASDYSIKNVSLNDSFISDSSIISNIAPYCPTSPQHVTNIPLMSGDELKITSQLQPANTTQNKKKKRNKSQKNKGNNHAIRLGDFLNTENISSSQSNEIQSKFRRRIRPTQLKICDNSENQQSLAFGVVNRPPTVNPQFTKAPSEEKPNKTSFEVERELLKLKRTKQPKMDILDTEPICQNKPPLFTMNVPNQKLVTNVESLNILRDLYSGLLMKNLVPNLMKELYFIISLITSQYKFQVKKKPEKSIKNSESNELLLQDSFEALKVSVECKDIDEVGNTPQSVQEASDLSPNNSIDTKKKKDKQLITIAEYTFPFKTVDDCVYFAITTLFQVKKFLEILDKSALKLLSDNHLIVIFHPELQIYLNKLYEKKNQLSKQTEPTNKSNGLQKNVYFEVESDGLENFVSRNSFSYYRKQRDLFYDLLKTWEVNYYEKEHLISLERKVASILNICEDVLNYYHLARLFKHQLLMSSVEYKQPEEPIVDKYSSISKNETHSDSNKLNRLEKRLVTPITTTSIDPVPSPSFPGVQKFYYDFIQVARNQNFLTILEHCFIQEITELNETQFPCSGIENRENTGEEITEHSYLIAVSKLRLMAKFLGLLISRLHQSEIKSVNIISTQIAIRSRVHPSLDLQECLNHALKHGKLTLTIPWIVQYLAMLDSIAFRLPYYSKVCEVLYYIYRIVHNFLNQKAALLITFSIGWLFELPHFPKDLYYNWYTNYDINKIPILPATVDEVEKGESIVNSSFGEQNLILDKIDIIGDRALYVCCPFLEAFKPLLISGNCNFDKNKSVNRHITPVSSQLSQSLSAAKEKNLQIQLRDAFFNCQPKSVKKTVDFVAERVASNCVQYIRQSVITKNEEKCSEIWNHKDKRTVQEKTNQIVALTKNVKEQCKEEMRSMVRTKVENAMESLLADDLMPAVKNMCFKITQTITIERINQWLDFYINNMINFESIKETYSKEESSKCLVTKVNNSDWRINNENHDPEAPSATSMLEELRNASWEVIEQHEEWCALSENQNLKMIQNLRATLFNREDVLPSIKEVLYKMSIDYVLKMIVFKEDLMTPKVEEKFIEVWKLYPKACKLFHNPLCVRNITLLMQTNDKTVWSRYGEFVGRLLTENLLNWNQFCEQCVAILRQEWPAEVLKSISICLTEPLNCFKSTSIDTEEIKSMIEWIAETCSALNNYSF